MCSARSAQRLEVECVYFWSLAGIFLRIQSWAKTSDRHSNHNPIPSQNNWESLELQMSVLKQLQSYLRCILHKRYIYIIIIIYCCCKCCCLKRLFYLSTTLGSHTNTSVGRFRNFSNAGDLDAMENEYPEYPLHGETWEIPIAMEVSIFSMGKLHKITYEWAFGCFWKEGKPIKGQ